MPNRTQCRKCLYRNEGESRSAFACAYILLIGCSRGCEPSPECTAFKPYKSAERKMLDKSAKKLSNISVLRRKKKN